MNFKFEDKKIFQMKSLLIVSLFLLSTFPMIIPLFQTTTTSTVTPVTTSTNQIASNTPTTLSNTIPKSLPNTKVLESTLDKALFNWVNSSTALDPSLYHFDSANHPIITVFAQPGSNLKLINNYMNVNSFVDLGSYGYVILGSVSSAQNLYSMVSTNPYIRVSSDPYISADSAQPLSYNSIQSSTDVPSPSITNDGMFIKQANAAGYNGSGVTIAMVDGGADFGNSDIQSAMALDSQGLPTSFDSEG